MRAFTAMARQILLGCLLMGVCAPVWARFQPVSCKNAFTEQQELDAGGARWRRGCMRRCRCCRIVHRYRSTCDSSGPGGPVLERPPESGEPDRVCECGDCPPAATFGCEGDIA